MRTTLRLGVAIAVLALSTLFGATVAQAAPPANDNFADRVALTSGVMASGNNVDATIEGGESFFAYGLNHSVWHEYTPTGNGVLAITTCSSFPSNLIGYTGALGTLSAASFSPASYTQGLTPATCGLGYLATVSAFPVTSGVPIKIHVGSAYGANTGNYELTATFTAVPANDDFANAVSLTDETPVSGNSLYATVEVNEEAPIYGAQRSVWYTFTPTDKGVVSIDVCSAFPAHVVTMTGSVVDTLTIASYSPPSYGASQAASCASGTRELTSMVDFAVAANVPLRIQVMGKSAGDMGAFDITANFKPLPANDDFANAVTLADGVETSGNSQYATVEVNEEESIYSARRSVWYTYTPTAKGVLSIDVCSAFPANVVTMTGSVVDTLTIASYSPASYGASVPATCESGTREQTSMVDFPVAANVPLRIQVMGKGVNDMGAFDITADFKPLPANDDFADAITLTSGATATGDSSYATVEVDEEEVVYTARRSVWYTFTPAFSGELEIETCSAFPAHVVAWTGAGVSTLTMHSYSPPSYVASTASSCDSGTRDHAYMAPQTVTSGVPIRIQVMGKNPNDMGEFSIRAELHAIPSNDLFASATDLGTDFSVSQADDNFATTANQLNEPQILAAARPGSVWYRWQAQASGPVVIDTCATPSANTAVGVFEAATETPTLAQLSAVAGGSATGGCASGSGAEVTIDAESGKFYWIAVASDSASDWHGRFTLSIGVKPVAVTQPTLIADDYFVGTELSLDNSSWIGATPITYEYYWFRCDENQSNCTGISGSTSSTYTLAAADIGSTLRARVSATNAYGTTTEFSDLTPVIDEDSDGDGFGDATDACPSNSNESPKTNGCPVEEISVDALPVVSGSAVVGSALSVNIGAASNSPGLDASAEAPGSTIFWHSCSSATDQGTCEFRVGGVSSYTVAANDVGRFIRAEIFWTNGEGSPQFALSVATAAVTQPAAPPAPPAPTAPTDPLTLSVKKSLGTVKRDKKGVFTFKGAVVTCGATATGPCTGTFAISAKIGKKTVKYGVGKTGQAAGKSAAVTFKPSSKLAKAIKKAKGKKLKVTLVFSVSAPGFAAQKATATATLK